MMQLSIIIPVLNEAHNIEKQLQSLRETVNRHSSLSV